MGRVGNVECVEGGGSDSAPDGMKGASSAQTVSFGGIREGFRLWFPIGYLRMKVDGWIEKYSSALIFVGEEHRKRMTALLRCQPSADVTAPESVRNAATYRPAHRHGGRNETAHGRKTCTTLRRIRFSRSIAQR